MRYADNNDRYQVQLSDDALVPEDLIHQNLVSLQSVQAFLGTGGIDLSLLDPLLLDYLRQEQISAADLGYRGVLGRLVISS